MHHATPSRTKTSRRQCLRLGAVALAPLTLGLAGCASLNTVVSEVASFGDWPAGRTGGPFAFDRLPSQAVQERLQSALEDAARPALAAAGFSPVLPGIEPAYLVQLGARITRTERAPWDDPLWWRGAYGSWRWAPWTAAPWPVWPRRLRPTLPPEVRYDREVAVLIRDRASGRPLYEARAVNDGLSDGGMAQMAALFAAALKDFPRINPTPTRVVVPLSP